MANWKASDIAKVFGANERVDLAEAERIADYGAVPGIVESGNFAFWNKADHDEPEQGMHTQRCSWCAATTPPIQLSRQISLPFSNVLVYPQHIITFSRFIRLSFRGKTNTQPAVLVGLTPFFDI